jgi:mycoredoxin
MENNEAITMYGTSWCSDCHRAQRIFKKYKVDYLYIDIEENPEAVEIVKESNNGRRVVPTIFFPDGSILIEPSNRELRVKLVDLEIISK